MATNGLSDPLQSSWRLGLRALFAPDSAFLCLLIFLGPAGPVCCPSATGIFAKCVSSTQLIGSPHIQIHEPRKHVCIYTYVYSLCMALNLLCMASNLLCRGCPPWGLGEAKWRYKAPKEYTKPRQTVQSSKKTMQRLQNVRQRPKCWTRADTNIN